MADVVDRSGSAPLVPLSPPQRPPIRLRAAVLLGLLGVIAVALLVSQLIGTREITTTTMVFDAPGMRRDEMTQRLEFLKSESRRYEELPGGGYYASAATSVGLHSPQGRVKLTVGGAVDPTPLVQAVQLRYPEMSLAQSVVGRQKVCCTLGPFSWN